MDSHQFLQYLIFLDQIQDTNPLLSKNFLNVILYKYFPNLKFLQFKAFFYYKNYIYNFISQSGIHTLKR